MSKKDEALKLALEALEYIHEGANNQGPHTGISWRCVSNKAESAITALREALAEQPAQQWNAGVPSLYPEPEPGVSIKAEYEPAQQEPVAWISESENLLSWDKFYDHMTPLYTHPAPQRTWVELTDEELDDIYQGAGKNDLRRAREVIAAFKERNT